MCSSAATRFAPLERGGIPFAPWFYKHFVPLGRGSSSEVIDSTATQSSHDRRTDEVIAAIHAILVNCGSAPFLTIYDLLFTIHGS
jgi:hypothetical protein